MSGRVSVPCWHATPVANAPWKPLIIGEGQARYQGHEIGGKSDWLGSKIEKVPRGIRGEKSSKDMACSRNLDSTIGALASPKMGDGTRCPEG